jgi:acyl-CoA thioesterase
MTSQLEPAEHVFDKATRVTAGDSQWSGRTSEDYWAFIGPFGGITAATMLRAIVEHSQREGDPLALTVNYCAPIAEGPFDLDVRLIKANRSTQHWSVELTQQGGETAAFATAVFAVRRPSWSHRPVARPEATPFKDTKRYPKSGFKMTWVNQYDFRFVEGQPLFGLATAPDELASPYSKLWIGDTKPRRLDALSLVSMSDAFFARIFHVRNEFVPFGTVSLTTYFHADAEDLIAEDASHVLAVADGSVFHKSYGDQTGALWSPSGKLLATTQQIAYFKA